MRIVGRVQGVWFRAWTEKQAHRLKLAGWVRNCRDGSVEALFSGPAQAVDEMLVACHRGPPAASVDTVSVSAADPPAEPGFRKLPTL